MGAGPLVIREEGEFAGERIHAANGVHEL